MTSAEKSGCTRTLPCTGRNDEPLSAGQMQCVACISGAGWPCSSRERGRCMLANAGTVAYLQASRCLMPCSFTGSAAAHHDQLLMVDQDMDQALALMELAVTWGELDYSAAALIGPSEWREFVATHRWVHRDRAEMLFSLAIDAVAHSVTASMVRVD